MTPFGTELHYNDNSPWSRLCSPPPFTYFHPDTMHILSPVSLPSLSVSCSLILTRLHSHLLLHLKPPLFSPLPVTSSAVGAERDSASKAPSLLSDRPQSQSLPLSGAEVYTHGKLIPMPCLPHIVLMSKVVRCVETWVTFSKGTLWEAITFRNNI